MKSKRIEQGSQVRVMLVVLGLSLVSQAGLALDRWEELTQAGLRLQQQGRMTEAEQNLREALNEAEESGGQDASRLAKSYHNLGALFYDHGKYPEAESFYQKAIATMEKQPGFDQRDLAGMLNNLALLRKKTGRYSEAEAVYLRSLTIVEKTLGPTHIDVATSLNNLAALYSEQGRYREAEPLCRRSTAILQATAGRTWRRSLMPRSGTSKRNRFIEERWQFWKRVWEQHPAFAASLGNYAEALRKLNRKDEAIEVEGAGQGLAGKGEVGVGCEV